METARAIDGQTDALFRHLARTSGLPGERANLALAESFAEIAVAHGRRADALLCGMATLTPAAAPGATAFEFLPVCGIYGLALAASKEERAYRKVVPLLHELADDLRFRVRDAVVAGLAVIGEKRSKQLVSDLASWTDGYHHAAAALQALRTERWLRSLNDVTSILLRVEESFHLLEEAPRAAARYPGHKELVDALGVTPRALALRFGTPVFDLFAGWTRSKDPDLRAIIEKNLDDSKLASRYGDEVKRVHKALADTAPPVRNPDHNFGPHRGRGKKNRR